MRGSRADQGQTRPVLDAQDTDLYGPDHLFENDRRLWPDTTTLPFHNRHPVTPKEFVPDFWGAFPEP